MNGEDARVHFFFSRHPGFMPGPAYTVHLSKLHRIVKVYELGRN